MGPKEPARPMRSMGSAGWGVALDLRSALRGSFCVFLEKYVTNTWENRKSTNRKTSTSGMCDSPSPPHALATTLRPNLKDFTLNDSYSPIARDTF